MDATTNGTRHYAPKPAVPLDQRRQWSVAEFAELFGISVPTVYRYARAGRIAMLKTPGRTFISREAAAAWQADMAAQAQKWTTGSASA